jgi:Nif-specific regulatory protein
MDDMIELKNEIQQLVEKNKILEEENQKLSRLISGKYQSLDFVGKSKEIQKVIDDVKKYSQTEKPVLIIGESGTGKNLSASSIHYNGRRSDKPLLKINCSNQKSLFVEYELFGYEKGSFAGALNTKKGLFELASGGTLVLESADKIDFSTQRKIAAIAEGKGYSRIGGNSTIKNDVRIIALTGERFFEELEKGSITKEFYSIFEESIIKISPLRERNSDIIILTNYFIGLYNKIYNKNVVEITPAAVELLSKYHWAGNVRELESSIEHIIVSINGNSINCCDLPPSVQNSIDISSSEKGTLERKLENIEYESIIDAIKSSKGNLSKSSKVLGLTERMLGLRIKKYNIDYKKFS